LKRHLQRSTAASYLENDIESRTRSATVLGADVDPPPSGQRLCNPLKVAAAKVARDIDADVREVERE
jgi:hypothetical protein